MWLPMPANARDIYELMAKGYFGPTYMLYGKYRLDGDPSVILGGILACMIILLVLASTSDKK